MSIEKEFLARECGYENGLDDVTYVEQMELELKLKDKLIQELQDEVKRLQIGSCEGCPEDCTYNRFGNDSMGYATDCTIVRACKRMAKDHYTPKDKGVTNERD